MKNFGIPAYYEPCSDVCHQHFAGFPILLGGWFLLLQLIRKAYWLSPRVHLSSIRSFFDRSNILLSLACRQHPLKPVLARSVRLIRVLAS